MTTRYSQNELDSDISRITMLLRHIVHRETVFLRESMLCIEVLNGVKLVYRSESRPDHVIERLYTCGPYANTTTIFIDQNRFKDRDRFVDKQNTLVVRCNEPHGLLLLGEDINLYKCEFDLGIDGQHTPQPSLAAPTIVVANGVSATSSRFQSASNGAIALGMCSAIAKDSIIRTHDDHAIIDISQAQITNLPRPIILEGYNWICEDAVVLKGVTIGYGSIVATKAVATKHCPRKSLFAGNPAKVVRQNVSWESSPYHFDLGHLLHCMQSCEDELIASSQSDPLDTFSQLTEAIL